MFRIALHPSTIMRTYMNPDALVGMYPFTCTYFHEQREGPEAIAGMRHTSQTSVPAVQEKAS
jgi:predicted urease superfamily metal-dependent hydrolase